MATGKRGKRRALSHVGGEVALVGAPGALREALLFALDVDEREEATLSHVHGFHSYPARLHPHTAARLVEALSKPRDTVLDPFAGSGTVLVEARRLGRRALGVDSNPLAVALAALKTRGISPEEAEELVLAARAVAEHAEARRLSRAGPTKRYPSEDRELFDVHVLLELDGLRDGISELGAGTRLAAAEARRMLELVLSALLTKVSKKAADTSEYREPRRLRAGFTITLFVKKTEELSRRMLEYSRLLPERAPPAAPRVGDARDLRIKTASIDLLVSSPPYPGIYDYLHQHTTRLRWLGFDARRFSRAEIGSRRELGKLDFDTAVARWAKDFALCLTEMSRVLRPRGHAALVVADSVLGNRPLYVDELVARLAPAAQLSVVAIGSQRRPHFHGPTSRAFRSRPRREHVFLLSRREQPRRA
jgi:hypothetical protein